jgi:hypothetical protein
MIVIIHILFGHKDRTKTFTLNEADDFRDHSTGRAASSSVRHVFYIPAGRHDVGHFAHLGRALSISNAKYRVDG